MISRRQLIRNSAALALLGRVGATGATVCANLVAEQSLALIVVDERFAAAYPLSQSIGSPQVPRVALSRDALEFWHQNVLPLSLSGTQAIGGVTTEHSFFLLRTLAADQRWRVRSQSTQGALVSWVIGPK